MPQCYTSRTSKQCSTITELPHDTRETKVCDIEHAVIRHSTAPSPFSQGGEECSKAGFKASHFLLQRSVLSTTFHAFPKFSQESERCIVVAAAVLRFPCFLQMNERHLFLCQVLVLGSGFVSRSGEMPSALLKDYGVTTGVHKLGN